jgi:uncharacterized protein (UPF0335 family)
MKIRLNGTVRGTVSGKATTWSAGEEFDDSKEKIPSDILVELNNKNPAISVIANIEDITSQGVSDKQLKALIEELENEKKEKSALQDELHKAQDTIKKLGVELDEAHGEIEKLKITLEDMRVPAEGSSETGEFDCPAEGCEKSFLSQRALSTHISKMHPELKDLN